MEYLSSSYLSLPSKSGVYVFLDDKNAVLYCGKAKDLKSRVSSYFANKSLLIGKTKIMVEQVKKIKITIVESELEALLLEAFYIKKYSPKYNILMKDGKSYILVRITIKDDFPKILLARKEDDPKSIYFGPFTSSSAVKLVLKTMRRIFPYQSVLNHPKRFCLYYHLGLCPCPPMFANSKEFKNNYRKSIRKIIRMFEGESQEIMHELEKERNRVSKLENFEEALELQRKINALSIVTTPFHKPFEYDVNPNLRTDIRQQELDELMKALNNVIASEAKQSHVIIKKFITKLDRIECYDISNIQGTNSTGSMVVLSKGEIDKSEYRRFRIRRDWEKSPPVSLRSQAGSFAKAQSAPNDFAMMQEVLKRRFSHEEWNMPDLIIVDGGKGQVSAATEILNKIGINIPLIGLAKREETIVIPRKQMADSLWQMEEKKEQLYAISHTPYTFLEVHLPKNNPALHLIMRIRDEAHRFAITYHKKLRSKTSLSTSFST